MMLVQWQDARSSGDEQGGHGPGGAGDGHHERQPGQDHGEGGEAAGPGVEGRQAAGGVSSVSGRKHPASMTPWLIMIVLENSDQGEETSLDGEHENKTCYRRNCLCSLGHLWISDCLLILQEIVLCFSYHYFVYAWSQWSYIGW